MARVSIYYAYYPCIVLFTYMYHMLGDFMIEGVNFLLDKIYVLFDNKVYLQVVDITLTTHRTPLLLYLSLIFMYYESQSRTKLLNILLIAFNW